MMSNGRGNLFKRCIYYLQADERKILFFWFAEDSRSPGKRPEDYIRSSRKRNIERNLIMSAMRACRARFRNVCEPGIFIHHRVRWKCAGASRKGFSDCCEENNRCRGWERCSNSVTRLRVGRQEIIFSRFLTSWEHLILNCDRLLWPRIKKKECKNAAERNA